MSWLWRPVPLSLPEASSPGAQVGCCGKRLLSAVLSGAFLRRVLLAV